MIGFLNLGNQEYLLNLNNDASCKDKLVKSLQPICLKKIFLKILDKFKPIVEKLSLQFLDNN